MAGKSVRLAIRYNPGYNAERLNGLIIPAILTDLFQW